MTILPNIKRKDNWAISDWVYTSWNWSTSLRKPAIRMQNESNWARKLMNYVRKQLALIWYVDCPLWTPFFTWKLRINKMTYQWHQNLYWSVGSPWKWRTEHWKATTWFARNVVQSPSIHLRRDSIKANLVTPKVRRVFKNSVPQNPKLLSTFNS